MADQSMEKRLNALALALENEQLFARLGVLVKEIIESRTVDGDGGFLNGNAKGYSDSYAMRRELRGLQTEFVDLQFSGGMWGSFDFATDKDNLLVELGFNREEMAKIASYHDRDGAGRSKVIREFLGLTEAEANEVSDFVFEEVGRRFDLTLEKTLPE